MNTPITETPAAVAYSEGDDPRVYVITVEHRTAQLKAITDTLTPHDWLELLKVK